MSTISNGPIESAERIQVLDVLRGIAVGGILVGNMQWFSGYGMMPPKLLAATPMYDQITQFLVHVLVEGKFYSIFSFLFGFGFAMQISRAAERGDTRGTIFKRRLAWLLVIGLLHAYLLWAGDILSIYALMGFVLLLFRKTSDRSLLKWAAVLLIIPVVTYVLLFSLFAAFVPANALAEFEAGQTQFWHDSVQKASQGTYLQIITDFNLQYIVGRYAGLIFQMRLPKILAMFLIGMYAYRRGIFQDPQANRPFIRQVAVYGISIGLASNLIFSWLSGNEAPFPPSAAGLAGVAYYAVGVPALALGIAAAVMILCQGGAVPKMLSAFAAVGRMALTNYLMQTIISVLIFYGYGLGKFGSFGALEATTTAFGIVTFQLIASSMWLRYFSYGPMEWIWRQLTYWQRLELRRP